MATDTNASDYATMVAEAETAVASVKDPQLRTVAFEKILTTLLTQKVGNAESSRSIRKGRRTANKISPSRPKKGKNGGPKGSAETLIDEGFFKKQRTIAEVKAELANGGRHIPFAMHWRRFFTRQI